jgi:drug/metabolite transporter (DMT)-like permease
MSIKVTAIASSLSATPKPRLRALLVGFAWAGLSVTIFAGWFVVTRFSVTHELRIWDIMALRFGCGVVLLSPVLITQRRGLPDRAWRDGMLFACLWGAPFVLFVALGLRLTSAAQASSITPDLMPVFAGFSGWLMLHERPGRSRLAGYVCIIVGLTALIIDSTQAGGRPSLIGITSLIFGAAMWATYTLSFRRSGLTPLQAAAMICFWSAIFYLPIYLLSGLSRLGDASLQEIVFQTIYQGCLMSVVAVITFNRAISLLGEGAATAIIALLPVIAIRDGDSGSRRDSVSGRWFGDRCHRDWCAPCRPAHRIQEIK